MAALTGERSPNAWHLVRGEVLALAPTGASRFELPEPLAVPGPEPVLARVDIEELYGFGRPDLETLEFARDFYFADDSGAALVRLAGGDGRLHPDVELKLAAPFVERPLEASEGALRTTAFVRVTRVGDPLYVLGRSRLEKDALSGGYRDPGLMAVFDAQSAPLYVYDEAAFRRSLAWHALPWYRKLSVLVRNR